MVSVKKKFVERKKSIDDFQHTNDDNSTLYAFYLSFKTYITLLAFQFKKSLKLNHFDHSFAIKGERNKMKRTRGEIIHRGGVLSNMDIIYCVCPTSRHIYICYKSYARMKGLLKEGGYKAVNILINASYQP